MKAWIAEGIGTFWLVFAGCGAAVMAATFPEVGIGLLGVSFAFGLAVLTMAYAISHISGCHLNPAVSIGLFTAGRLPREQLLPYIVAQLIGAVLASGALLLIASGQPDFQLSDGFATNGYGVNSPGGYALHSALVIEVLLTAFFVFIIMGVTDAQNRAPTFMAPVAIGLALTLIHLISIPVTNTSVNPARSTGPALIAGGDALIQLWLFWLAPIAGGVAGALAYDWLVTKPQTSPNSDQETGEE